MKKVLKKALKPQKTFEEWATENDVELQNYTPIKSRYILRRTPQKKMFAGLASAVAVCLILAILLPIVLSGGTNPIVPNTKYTSQDIESELIEIENLYELDGIRLFDLEQIAGHKRVCRDVAKDNKDLILGYIIQECLLVSSDGANGFNLNFLIRTYEYYEFLGNIQYLNLPQAFFINGVEIQYRIHEESGEKKAYLKFRYAQTEYFLEVKGFPEVTEITEDTLMLLLNDLLP